VFRLQPFRACILASAVISPLSETSITNGISIVMLGVVNCFTHVQQQLRPRKGGKIPRAHPFQENRHLDARATRR
jgi:hypothetical protein